MPRQPRATDLYELRVPLEAVISPDGSRVVFAVKEVAPAKDTYHAALWIVPADGSQRHSLVDGKRRLPPARS